MIDNNSGSLLFVGGINRSGTTLLQSVLCADSTTNPLLHEASYLRNVLDAYDVGKIKFEEHGRYYFDSVDDLREFTAEWARAFIARVRRRYPQAATVVLKYPPLTPRFPALAELLPEARFVVVVRDPRDVAASLVAVGERLRAGGDPEGQTLPRDMTRLGSLYMQCYAPIFSCPDPEFRARLTVVRYEDLVTKPDEVVRQLRAATGLALDQFQPAGNWQNNRIDLGDLRASRNAWVSDLWGRPVSDGRVGQFRNLLSAAEIATIEQICRPAMESFQYR